jgi:hypothetical protein
VTFDNIIVDWLKHYEQEMINEGKSFTTISMYIRCIRTLFNEGIDTRIIKENIYPFGKKLYEIPVGLIQEKRLSRQNRTGIRQKAYLQADTLLFRLFLNMDTRIKRT